MKRRLGRTLMQLLDELKEKRGYCKLKEEALERTYWRTRFGGGYGSVVRLGNERMGERTSKRVNELVNIIKCFRYSRVCGGFEFLTCILKKTEVFWIGCIVFCFVRVFTSDVKMYVSTLRNIPEDSHFKIVSVSLSNLHVTT